MSQPKTRQSGAVLFIALIVLVAMSLAGIAMIRGVDTASLIAGNLAFRQGATQAGDNGLEAARAWLLVQDQLTPNPLFNDGAAGTGYYASMGSWDFTGADPATADFPWSTGALAQAADAAGNQVSYVIHRLCGGSGDPKLLTTCVKAATSAASEGSSKAGGDYASPPTPLSPRVFYRITAKITGPRNTVSYVQSLMN